MPMINKQLLLDAPMYTVFRKRSCVVVQRDVHGGEVGELYDTFQVDGRRFDDSVMDTAYSYGICVAHIDDQPMAVMRDDELAPDGYDDTDAAVDYLSNDDGCLVKLPDDTTSDHYRFYEMIIPEGIE